jgi:hypothetical protein
MNSYEFLHENDGGKTHVVIDAYNESPTWWELTSRFKEFLNGCGYQMSWEDLRDYCDELCEPQVSQVENDDLLDVWNQELGLVWPIEDTNRDTTSQL